MGLQLNSWLLLTWLALREEKRPGFVSANAYYARSNHYVLEDYLSQQNSLHCSDLSRVPQTCKTICYKFLILSPTCLWIISAYQQTSNLKAISSNSKLMYQSSYNCNVLHWFQMPSPQWYMLFAFWLFPPTQVQLYSTKSAHPLIWVVFRLTGHWVQAQLNMQSLTDDCQKKKNVTSLYYNSLFISFPFLCYSS